MAARTRARVEDTCCGPVPADAVVRLRLHQTALGLLHELLRGGFTGPGCGYGRGAGSGGGQCLIVNLVGHFLFIHQQFVALQIILRAHIVGLGLKQLGVGCGELLLGGNDPRFGVYDVRLGETRVLDVLTEVMGTVIFSDLAVASALAGLASACATAT